MTKVMKLISINIDYNMIGEIISKLSSIKEEHPEIDIADVGEEPVAWGLWSGTYKHLIPGSLTFDKAQAEEWVGPNGKIEPLYSVRRP